jgi:hypothetical protein
VIASGNDRYRDVDDGTLITRRCCFTELRTL